MTTWNEATPDCVIKVKRCAEYDRDGGCPFAGYDSEEGLTDCLHPNKDTVIQCTDGEPPKNCPLREGGTQMELSEEA